MGCCTDYVVWSLLPKNGGMGGSICAGSVGDLVEPCKNISEGSWLSMDAWMGLGLWGTGGFFRGLDYYLMRSQTWGIHVDLGGFQSVLAWARERKLGVDTSPGIPISPCWHWLNWVSSRSASIPPQSPLCPDLWPQDLSVLFQYARALRKYFVLSLNSMARGGSFSAISGPLHPDMLS